MVRRCVITSAVALACASTFVAAQSQPGADQQQPGSRPTTQAPTSTATAQQASTTLVGCLYREEQIPGRTPNVAERAGVLEDYILADAAMPAQQGAQARPGATAGAAGTSGTAPKTGNMYKVENIPDERLKALVGKRVEVIGRIDPEGIGRQAGAGGAARDRGLGPDEVNLPEFEAASIREAAGTCPTTPAPRK